MFSLHSADKICYHEYSVSAELINEVRWARRRGVQYGDEVKVHTMEVGARLEKSGYLRSCFDSARKWS